MLRWHEVNGTYPARTIKATLYDNEEGGLVGSGDYSAAGTAATIVAAPTAVGDTTSRSPRRPNLGAGTTIAIDEVNTENPSWPRSARRRRTRRLPDRPSAGGTRHQRRERHGLSAGQTVKIDLGPIVDTATIGTVGTAPAHGDDAGGGGKRRRHEHQGRLGHEHGRRREHRYRRRVPERRVRQDHRGRHGRRGGYGRHAPEPARVRARDGAAAQDLGSGITLTSAAHVRACGNRPRDRRSALGTGITLTAPLAKAHPSGRR